MERIYEDEAPKPKSRLFVFLILFVVVLVVIGAFTLLQRKSQ